MKPKEIPIKQATLEQLYTFATLSLGLDVPDGATETKLRAMIATAWPHEMIRVADTGAPKTAPASPGQRHRGPMRALAEGQDPTEKIWIRLPATKEPGGALAVPVGVNGSIMLIPRDEDCLVPRAYVQVLLDAIEWQYESEVDAQGRLVGMKSTPREVMSYPIQILGG